MGDTDGIINFASSVSMSNIAGTDVDIDGRVAGVNSLNGAITFSNAINNTAGQSVSVQGVAASAAVSFNGTITDSGTGIVVNSNSGGEIAFNGAVNSTINSVGAPAATAIALTSNTGANIDFTAPVIITATGSANGFVATGGGTISGPNTTNSITTDSGQALMITDMTIANGDFRIGDLKRNLSAGTNAIQLERNKGTGSIIVGATTDNAGDAGSIAGGTVDAIRILDSANTSIHGLTITNTSAVAGVHVEKSSADAMTTDLGGLAITGGTVGVDTVGGGTGAITMTLDKTTITNPATDGLRFNGLNAGTVNVTATTLDGGNITPAAGGVLISNNKASISFDSASTIRKFQGTDFEVAGGSGTISYAGKIENSNAINAGDNAGNSVNVHNMTGGSVTFTAPARLPMPTAACSFRTTAPAPPSVSLAPIR